MGNNLSENEYGEEVVGELESYETRAYITSVSSKRMDLGEINTFYQKKFAIRNYCDIDMSYFIEYGGFRYRILSIDRNVSKQNIEIIAELMND